MNRKRAFRSPFDKLGVIGAQDSFVPGMSKHEWFVGMGPGG